MKVESGQLRQWRPDPAVGPDGSGGSVFLVIERDPAFKNDPFWRVLKSEGGTKLWSQMRIERWSEVIDEDAS
jgi:hypothetical protein